MKKYARLAVLTIVAVISLLAVTVVGYSARDALELEGITFDSKVFAVVLLAVLLVVHGNFVKLALGEINRLNAQSSQQKPKE